MIQIENKSDCCGYYLKDKQRLPHIIALAGIGLFMKTIVARTEILQFFGNYVIGGNSFILCLLSGIFAVVLINNVVVKTIDKYRVCMPLIYVGQQSMAFYVTHWVLLTICKILVVDFWGIEDKWVFFWSMLASCVILLPLIVKLLRRKTRLLA